MIIDAPDLALITKFIAELNELTLETGVYLCGDELQGLKLWVDGNYVGYLAPVEGTSRLGFTQ